ncbi:MAG: hypothetical protein GWO38_26225 [Phycisphaerae bacterium]|nr:hypothetical protein [Phycisphaerae bacterium]NIX31031.1 hypothetical protein [Phycisphaerae bacterium]
MRKLKFVTSLIVLLMMVLSLVPAAVEAKAGDEDELNDTSAVSATAAGDEDELVGDEDEIVGDEDEIGVTSTIRPQEGEGEGSGEGGSLAGTGIALALIGLILVLLAVVAVIGAASLGIIGLGYWQSESSD